MLLITYYKHEICWPVLKGPAQEFSSAVRENEYIFTLIHVYIYIHFMYSQLIYEALPHEIIHT